MSSANPDPFVAQQFERTPQMRDYAALEPVLHPYLGFTTPANFRSPSVTTDAFGFRQSEFQGKVVSAESVRELGDFGVALGGSFTFGVGATHDRHSLASRLGEELGKPFLNRAVRAGNSMQEFLAALPVLDRAHDVVVCTGVNTLGVAYWSARTYDDLGPFFYDQQLALLAGRRLDDLAAALGATGLKGTLKGGLAAARDRQRLTTSPRPALDPQAITHAAAHRHLRELKLVVAASGPSARVVFVLQPFMDPNVRRLHPEERALVGPGESEARDLWGSTIEFIGQQWQSYTEELRAGCETLRVPFGLLDASAFDGWAFVDRVHMSDHGQQQAAVKIVEVMGHGTA